ncbi:MAG: GNAT family N-acetyltransferase [Halioglobus sp.]|nr:GNAT family N-acetyltransferase [Halioglobus sp.]
MQRACREQGAGPRQVLLARCDGVVAGFLQLYRAPDDGSIENVAVAPGFRRRGVARALVSGALHSLRLSGARRCILEVRASNSAALGLYRGLGFQADGVRRGYYPAGDGDGREDAVLMSLLLEVPANEHT